MNFLDSFSRNAQIPNFMKIRLVGFELFRADGQRMDIHGNTSGRFSEFANASKNVVRHCGSSEIKNNNCCNDGLVQ